MKKPALLVVGTIAILAFAAAAMRAWPDSRPQSRPFTPVEGDSFSSKLAAAIKSGHAQSQPRFWIAYAFEVRPRVSILERGITVRSPGDLGVSTDRGVVFLSCNQNDFIEGAQLQDLQRGVANGENPVFWLGDAKTDESLGLLGQIAESSQIAKSGHPQGDDPQKGFTATPTGGIQVVNAIALHHNPQADALLEKIARSQSSDIVRARAVSWLATFGEADQFLTEFIQNQRAGSLAALEAIRGLAQSTDDRVLNQLKSLAIDTDDITLATRVIASLSDSKGQQSTAMLEAISKQAHSPRVRQFALLQLQRLNDQ